MKPRTSVFLLLMLAAGKLSADNTGSISGHVYAADTGQPLPRANVLLGSASRYAATDISGSFLFRGLSPDSYRVYISHVGYASVEREILVTAGETAGMRFDLVPSLALEDPVVVTASRVPSSLLHSSVTTHVVDNVGQSVGLQTAADLLRSLPGVDLSGGGAPGLVAGVSLRGASPGQTLVLLDGVRLNTAGQTSTLGGVDLGEVGVDRLERVEVVKGPGSALYGADAGGGVIQLFTRGIDGGHRTWVSMTAGTGARVDDDGAYATQRYHLLHGRRHGDWEWTVDGSMGSSGGHLENTDTRVWNAAGKLVHHHTDGQTLIRTELARRRGGAPGAEGHGQVGAFDIDDRQNDDRVRISVSDRRPLRTGLRFESNASGQWRRVERLNPIVQAGELSGDFLSRHQLWILEPRLHWTRRHLRPLTLGAEYRFERQRDGLFGTETAGVGALYVQNRFELDRHVLEAGARLDDHSLYGTQFNPRISAALQVRDNLVFHSAIGRAFVAPSFDDLFKPTEVFSVPIDDVVGETGNRNLKPERVWSADVGLRWLTRRSQSEATLYWSRYRDLIRPVTRRMEVAGRDDLFLTFDNLARADIAGLELSQSLRLHRKSKLRLSYTFQDASGEDDLGTSRNLPGRLRQKLTSDYSLGLGEAMPVRLSVRADWQERFFDEDLFVDDKTTPDEEVDDTASAIGAPRADWSYLILGASALVQVTPAISLHADAANFADERYQSVFGIPQPGLVVSGGLKLNLD